MFILFLLCAWHRSLPRESVHLQVMRSNSSLRRYHLLFAPPIHVHQSTLAMSCACHESLVCTVESQTYHADHPRWRSYSMWLNPRVLAVAFAPLEANCTGNGSDIRLVHVVAFVLKICLLEVSNHPDFWEPMHPGKAEITFLSKLLPASASLPLSTPLVKVKIDYRFVLTGVWMIL